MSKKRFFLIIAIVFLIGLGLFVISKLRNTDTNQEQTQNKEENSESIQFGEKISNSKVEDPFKNESEGITITSSINPSQTNTPKILPLYELSSEAIQEKDITSLASQLGFKTKAITTEDETGKTYFYSENIKSLWVQAQKHTIVYKTGVYDLQPLRPDISNDAIKKAAIEQLVKYKFITDENEVTFNGIHKTSISAEGHTVPDSQNDMAVVSFTKNNLQLPENTFSSLGTILISLNYKLETLSISSNDTNNIKEIAKYPIKTDEEFKKDLPNAKLQALDNGNLTVLELYPRTVRQVRVNKITISYVESANKQWQPVFVLTGSATFSDRSTTDAILYLPAISNEYLSQ